MSHLQLLTTLTLIAHVLQIDGFQLHHGTRAGNSAVRVPRSPSKFESLKRREREQRLIELGAITPDIASDTPREIRAHEGDTVYLPCRVPHLGTHSVTWETNGAIISVDTMLVHQRPRLAVSHDDDVWRLVIKSAQESDAGAYTCTVTTEPRQQRAVTLFVLPRSASLMYDSYGIILGDIRSNLTAVWTELRGLQGEIARLLHGSEARENAGEDQEVWVPPRPTEQHRNLHHHPVYTSSLAHSRREESVVYEPELDQNRVDSKGTGLPEEHESSAEEKNQLSTSEVEIQETSNIFSPSGISRPRHPYRNSRLGSRRRQHRLRQAEATAECALSADLSRVPDSHVSGTILLSQPGDLSGPVSLDIHMTGLRVSELRRAVLALTLHRYAVTGSSCYRVGSVVTTFDEGANGGVDDLSNMEVDMDGTLRRHLQLPEDLTLFGLSGITGKSIVVSSVEDGISRRAGPPVACCTIQPTRSRTFSDVD